MADAELADAELVTVVAMHAVLVMAAEAVMLAVLPLAAHRLETACSMAVSDERSRAPSAVVVVADVQPLQAADVRLLLQAAVASEAGRKNETPI